MLDRDLISPGRIFANVRINSKKRLLQLIATTLAKKNKELNSREIFESFCDRENLGSTALGNGVAIPHGRISGTDEVEALFLQLVQPLSYETDDGQPVDLIFALVVPQDYTEDHAKLLSSTAERFSDVDFLEQLRSAEDANEIWQLLSNAQ
ncbi:MAG: PTS transporter subunit EIIA [Xanthomonadales bacterium]|nr:PTS sugar transporter subunit IIA [Gammaproteobacteria bacterium]MBT8072498.1 PTS sugar transporter subunit IIA [Gammaproteobacteria bacterium]NNK03340.1 PTS transporter subunit EIIA [Xanthomonadales bacterium]